MRSHDDENRRREEEALKLLEDLNYTIVGTYQKQKNFGFVVPDNRKFKFDVYVESKNSLRAFDGSKVMVRIVKFPHKKDKNPEGIITEILGDKNDPEVELLSIVRNFGIPYIFDADIIKEAKTVSKENPANNDRENLCKETGRKDLRNIFTVTIDSESAKDLDDAISIEECVDEKTSQKLMKLYVHIADVSHYVKEKSLLDKEAFNRGTSVYLLDRVIPMLPKELSNGVCSLNAHEDRFALTVEMNFDSSGKIVFHEIYSSLINVDMRMSYNGVHACLNDLELNNGEDINEYNKHKAFLQNALQLSQLIRKRREDKGAIDFNIVESVITVDENLKPLGVCPVERNEAHKLIEDFMLSANETVAKEYSKNKIPFLYRVHENPDPEKIEELNNYISKLGFSLNTKNNCVKALDIQNLLKSIEGKPEESVIEKLTLRSMKQARYFEENLGHFALALDDYCHFTSPIRRYPDLQIHRIIKEQLRGELDDKRKKHYNKIMPNVGVQTSTYERRAVDCERDVDKLKQCQYMHDYIGEIFTGHISGLTNFGIYVELENTIEGMIPLRDLKDDYYIYDEDNLEIYGERTNKKFIMGQELRVMVAAVSEEMRTIDFALLKE